MGREGDPNPPKQLSRRGPLTPHPSPKQLDYLFPNSNTTSPSTRIQIIYPPLIKQQRNKLFTSTISNH